jgi:hypothetical protein
VLIREARRRERKDRDARNESRKRRESGPARDRAD